jgi:hypothetical protein
MRHPRGAKNKHLYLKYVYLDEKTKTVYISEAMQPPVSAEDNKV